MYHTMRYYSASIKARVNEAPATLGTQLARAAIGAGLSVVDIAKATGATRTTVYSWYSGKGVTNAYRARVTRLILKLTKAETKEAPTCGQSNQQH